MLSTYHASIKVLFCHLICIEPFLYSSTVNKDSFILKRKPSKTPHCKHNDIVISLSQACNIGKISSWIDKVGVYVLSLYDKRVHFSSLCIRSLTSSMGEPTCRFHILKRHVTWLYQERCHAEPISFISLMCTWRQSG